MLAVVQQSTPTCCVGVGSLVEKVSGKGMVPDGASRDCSVAALMVASIVASFAVAVAVDEPTLEMGSMAAHWRSENFADSLAHRH